MSIDPQSTRPLTPTEVATQIRRDLQVISLKVFSGEEVFRSICLWQDGHAVVLTLTGQALLQKMEEVASNLVWRSAFEQCVDQLDTNHPAERQVLAAAIALA